MRDDRLADIMTTLSGWAKFHRDYSDGLATERRPSPIFEQLLCDADELSATGAPHDQVDDLIDARRHHRSGQLGLGEVHGP
ncbi:hypothetical protein GCM10027030_00610 [Luteococcus sediminum]